jgi:hypothetical protein
MYKRDNIGKCRSPDPVGETLMNKEEEQSQVCEEVKERKSKVRELEQELLHSETLLKDVQGQGCGKENLDIIRDHIQRLKERLEKAKKNLELAEQEEEQSQVCEEVKERKSKVRELEQDLLHSEALLKDWRLSMAKDKIPIIRDHIQRLNERLQKAKRDLELAEQSKIAEELQLEHKKTGMERLAKKAGKLKRDIEKEFQSPTIIDLTTPDKVLQCDRDKEKEAENVFLVRNLIAQVVSCRRGLNDQHFVTDQLFNEFELVFDDFKDYIVEKKKGWKTSKFQIGERLTFKEGMTKELLYEAFQFPCTVGDELLAMPYFTVTDIINGNIVVYWGADCTTPMTIKKVKFFKADLAENRCIECFVDMGPNNPRQWCGKWQCNDDLREARNIQAVKHTTEKQREVKRKLEMSERTEEEYEIKRITNIDTEKRTKSYSSHDVNRKTVKVPK